MRIKTLLSLLVAADVYLVRLNADGYSATEKLVMQR